MKRLYFIAAACCLLSACATVNPMAVDKKSKTVDTTSKSVVLMTVDVFRSDGSRYVPEPHFVKVERPGAQDKADRDNFKLDKQVGTFQKDGHMAYMVSMALTPGDYILSDVVGLASAFPFNGFFEVPLLVHFTVKPHSIAYVGHLTAKLRPRNEGEFRAGPLFPLIDQSATGMSTSTWDIALDDSYAKEVGLYRTTYPALTGSTIDDSPLPPFDRAVVQHWWDGENTSDNKTVVATQSQSQSQSQGPSAK